MLLASPQVETCGWNEKPVSPLKGLSSERLQCAFLPFGSRTFQRLAIETK
jgi:hypothetical protein